MRKGENPQGGGGNPAGTFGELRGDTPGVVSRLGRGDSHWLDGEGAIRGGAVKAAIDRGEILAGPLRDVVTGGVPRGVSGVLHKSI